MGINPTTEIERIKKERAREEKANATSQNFMQKFLKCFQRKKVSDIENTIPAAIRCIDMNEYPAKRSTNNFNIKHVIIDCSCVNFIDSQGVNGILQVSQQELGIEIKK